MEATRRIVSLYNSHYPMALWRLILSAWHNSNDLLRNYKEASDNPSWNCNACPQSVHLLACASIDWPLLLKQSTIPPALMHMPFAAVLVSVLESFISCCWPSLDQRSFHTSRSIRNRVPTSCKMMNNQFRIHAESVSIHLKSDSRLTHFIYMKFTRLMILLYSEIDSEFHC